MNISCVSLCQGDEDTNSEGALNAARRKEGHRQRMEKEAQERNAMMIWRCEGVKARLAGTFVDP